MAVPRLRQRKWTEYVFRRTGSLPKPSMAIVCPIAPAWLLSAAGLCPHPVCPIPSLAMAEQPKKPAGGAFGQLPAGKLAHGTEPAVTPRRGPSLAR